MDTTDPDISFDNNGVCNHCRRFDIEIKPKLLLPAEGRKILDEIVTKIKKDGIKKEYDCILGLSGGVDSAFVAYKAKELGLRPLVVHFDNGWNTEISIKNIEQIVKTLGFDLETYVMDWEEFKDIQRSFFKASVVDIELITDHSFLAALYDIASRRKIKYILEGVNFASEAILPDKWRHFKKDLMNIESIQNKYGTMPIKNLPTMGVFKYLFYKFIKRFECVSILNYMDYNRDEAMKILTSEVGWKNYGNKHCESLFTYFYQAYILPLKFNIDKRKAHLSSLILSGQISREQALKIIEEEPYPSKVAEEYKEYVAKKLGFTVSDFDEIMRMPVKSHYDYSSEEKIYVLMHKVFKYCRRIGLLKS